MNVNEVIAGRANEMLDRRTRRQDRRCIPTIMSIWPVVERQLSDGDAYRCRAVAMARQLLAPDDCRPASTVSKTRRHGPTSSRSVVRILQDATPLTLGQEFSGYASQLYRLPRAHRTGGEQLCRLAQGGTAVGTGLNAPPGFGARFLAEIARAHRKLRFCTAENKFEALARNDALVDLSGSAQHPRRRADQDRQRHPPARQRPALRPRRTVAARKRTRQLDHARQGQPHPVRDADDGCGASHRQSSGAVTVGGMQGHLELNVFKPLIGANVLRSIELLSIGMDSFAKNCVEGIEPNRERIAELVERSLMLVTALAPVIGYDNAAKIAKHAHQNNLTLKQAALALGLVDEATFDTHVRAEDMV